MSTTNKTVNEKIVQLDALVAWFDSDEFEIEEAIGKFREVEKLAEEIEADLLSLKNEVTILKKKFDEAA